MRLPQIMFIKDKNVFHLRKVYRRHLGASKEAERKRHLCRLSTAFYQREFEQLPSLLRKVRCHHAEMSHEKFESLLLAFTALWMQFKTINQSIFCGEITAEHRLGCCNIAAITRIFELEEDIQFFPKRNLSSTPKCVLFLEKPQLTYISLEVMGSLFAMSTVIMLKRKRLLTGTSHVKHSWIPGNNRCWDWGLKLSRITVKSQGSFNSSRLIILSHSAGR